MVWRLVHLLSPPVLHLVVSAIILLRLDYGNSAYLDLPNYLLTRLQVDINDVARLVLGLPIWTHATPLLHSLHWLLIKKKVEFKSLCMTFKAVNGAAPPL